MSPAVDRRRRATATTAGLVGGGLAYYLTLLDYRTDLTRTANSLGYASNFFDFQARAFLHGHLYVPRGSLGIEAFERGGHEYMYFGPFPALLRLPVLLTTHEYDGRLTLVSMGLAFLLMAVMTTRLAWLVRDLLHGAAPVGGFEAATMGVLLALATGGTVLTFNASLPWVYHEAYAWAVPLAVGAMYWMTRVLTSPSTKAAAWLGGFAVCLVLTRTTGGWAVCLTTVAAGLWLLARSSSPQRGRVGWAVVAAGVLPLAVGIAYNVVKFRHPYLFPLQDQVWTRLNAHRREALQVNGGTITGPQFFRTSLHAYFRVDGIRFVDYFPWITLPASPARAVGGAFLDQSYRTGSVTAFMPLSLALTVLAVPALVMRGGRAGRRLLFPLLAGVLTTGGVMGYGYLAHRYTCEFVPLLVLGSAVGLSAVNRWLVPRSAVVKAAALTVLVVGTAFSFAANMLTGYAVAATTAGGDALVRYLELQHRLTPQAQAALLSRSEEQPVGGSTDDLRIVGSCDGLYLNTGDDYEPWELVQRRSVVTVVTLRPQFRAVRTPLVTISTRVERTVWLQTNNRGEARLLLVSENGVYPGPWFTVPPPRTIRVGVRDVPEFGYAEVTSTPGGWVGYVRAFDWDSNWVAHSTDIRPVTDVPPLVRRRGVSVTPALGLAPDLCLRLDRALADRR